VTGGLKPGAGARLGGLAPTLLHTPRHVLAGDHYVARLRELLSNPDVKAVLAASYVTEVQALEQCGLLEDRTTTRILVRPPDGLSRLDAERLAGLQGGGLKVKQLKAGADTALAHLKVVHMRSDADRKAVVGSSNLTSRGLTENVEVNVLVDPTFVGFDNLEATLERLWSDEMSQELDPAAFVTELDGDGYGAPLNLLDFQAEKLRELKEYYRENKGKGGAVLSLPTGTGKTVIAARFLLDEVLRGPKARVLWLAPQIELVVQAATTFAEQRLFARFPQLRIEPPERLLSPRSRSELDSDYNVIFRTLQTAAKQADGDRFDVVVVDEAHWGASESCSLMPDLERSLGRTFWLGLTATPFRRNAMDLDLLRRMFPHRVARPAQIENATDAVGRRVRAEVVPDSMKTGFKIALDVKTLVAHELEQRQLWEFNDQQRNRRIAGKWNKNEHGRTLVFAINVDHANRLCEAFKSEHPGARVQVSHSGELDADLRLPVPPVDGRFGEQERREIYRRFRRGDIDVLIGVNLYTTGVDFPAVQTLFMSRPTLSPVLYAQMLGRGRRGPAFGGTDTVRVVDFADQVDAHTQLGERLIGLMNLERERSYDERVRADEEKWEAIKRTSRKWKNPLTKARRDGPAVYRILTPGRRDVRKRLRAVKNLDSALANYVKGNSARRKHVVEYFVATPSATLAEVEMLVRRFAPDEQYGSGPNG